MSGSPDLEPRDRELERLLASARRPAARPAFRSDLKERFLAGPELAPSRAAPGVSAPRRPAPLGRVFPFVWPLVVAASITFLVVYVMRRDATMRWRVVGVDGGGQYVVDGARVHSSEGTRLLDLVQTAREIETFDAGLRLQLNDELVLELAPRTRVSELSFPPANPYTIHSGAGSVRVTTGPGFANRLRLLTNDLEMAVVGTTFGVDIEADGTCLCCLSGTVKCDARDGKGMLPLPAGRMCFAYNTGKPSLWGEAPGVHTDPLQKLQAFAAAAFKTPR